MFTGIIEITSNVLTQKKEGSEMFLVIARPKEWELTIGQSIAVNGTCLTVTSFDETSFSVTLVSETLDKTVFGEHVPEVVNLERALMHGGRLDGHMVQGHVDTTGSVVSFTKKGSSYELTISYDPSFDTLLIPKGSVAIDGVSLTVVDCTSGAFSVALIPHTIDVTTFSMLKVGDEVNLEFDIIGKYINKQK